MGLAGGEGKVGGKWRGARVLPSGGLGSSGEGRRRRVRGEGRPAVGLSCGGGAPAVLGGRSRTEELRWGEAKLVEGSIWGGTGRDGGSTRGQGRGGANGADGGSRPLRRGWEGDDRLGSFSSS